VPPSPSSLQTAVEFAVRGAGLGPVPGIVLGAVPGRAHFAPRRVAVAIRTPGGHEWTPFMARTGQILVTWDRWRAIQTAALIDHPWPPEAVHRAVERLPEETRRILDREVTDDRCAFVVDASKPIQAIATTLLTMAGFSVETFDTPAALLRRAAVRRSDIIVMEPRSPGLDALTTMRSLRALHRDRAAPVIWCTTVVPTPEQSEEGEGLGLRGVILKPLRLDAFVTLCLQVCHDEQREGRRAEERVPPDDHASGFLGPRRSSAETGHSGTPRGARISLGSRAAGAG
jgi:CheY-like chemotaxis protein